MPMLSRYFFWPVRYGSTNTWVGNSPLGASHSLYSRVSVAKNNDALCVASVGCAVRAASFACALSSPIDVTLPSSGGDLGQYRKNYLRTACFPPFLHKSSPLTHSHSHSHSHTHSQCCAPFLAPSSPSTSPRPSLVFASSTLFPVRLLNPHSHALRLCVGAKHASMYFLIDRSFLRSWLPMSYHCA